MKYRASKIPFGSSCHTGPPIRGVGFLLGGGIVGGLDHGMGRFPPDSVIGVRRPRPAFQNELRCGISGGSVILTVPLASFEPSEAGTRGY